MSSYQVDYELTPGICLGDQKCRIVGPRCVKGYCSACCEHMKAHKADVFHEPPPAPGEFRPLKAVLVGSTQIK